jgi:hypothetical protein
VVKKLAPDRRLALLSLQRGVVVVGEEACYYYYCLLEEVEAGCQSLQVLLVVLAEARQLPEELYGLLRTHWPLHDPFS